MKKKENILVHSLAAGGAAVLTAQGLNKFYSLTSYYPPDWVFWFFIGIGSYMGAQAVEQLNIEKYLIVS